MITDNFEDRLYMDNIVNDVFAFENMILGGHEEIEYIDYQEEIGRSADHKEEEVQFNPTQINILDEKKMGSSCHK